MPGVPWRSDDPWTPLSLPRRTLRVESWLVLPSLLAVLIAACGSPSADDGSRSSGSPSTSPQASIESVESAAPTAPSETATLGRGRVGLPDPGLTPGATNPAVNPDDLATTVCRSGWSKSVRPPVSYTGTLKRTQIREYGYEDRDAGHYQEDHLIPLSIGGAPRDPANLWPEPLTATLPDGTEVGAETKDRFELYLHAAVCDGSIPLRAAQRQMAGDWIAGWEAAGRP